MPEDLTAASQAAARFLHCIVDVVIHPPGPSGRFLHQGKKEAMAVTVCLVWVVPDSGAPCCLGLGGMEGVAVGPSRSKGRGSIGSLICVCERAAPRRIMRMMEEIEG